ncbi:MULTISPECIES: adenylyl-sulfate kinase [Mesonia]|uniref:Adenylyl-sulfate kinase n=1 Tax=Mesonia oceanica TaxID=2687242 RepID=A0AC61Y5E4_9FLAO|nr:MULTISPECIES: adenylyl-sulfate kinase [Mesonia]MAN28956.1 adenylyl-sulfate kinase [Mesonia sp.]MAQ42736.1 adenylyl-sulfate kinase [Mesonia sp.]MBJ99274.1 adenylyl-sulfate kinase [Flavobacteriaceae bacterium]VVU99726.1 putative adenylyl-sulfate kinase [Mesonia oceanica]|tara:strand:- start:30019 stop:30603 length:585 start_codon:yes stop_codon:yes gene_type:complete
MSENIFKQDFQVTQKEREGLHQHPGKLIWFTGLSGSGKSTLANALEKYWHDQGLHTYVLDGDNIRRGVNRDLDFTPEGRAENLRRIAEIGKLFVDAGILTIAAFVSPLIKDRSSIKEIVGADHFVEVYIKASVETCEKRDVKGLYKKARSGEISNFTGISAPYEEPKKADMVIDTERMSLEEGLEKLVNQIGYC